MRKTISTIADLVTELVLLKKSLEGFKDQLEENGNYEKRLLAKETEPTNVYIKMLINFLRDFRTATEMFTSFEENFKGEFPSGDIRLICTDIRDTIYRAGKYEINGVNQNPNGQRIKSENIFLGNPPGTWQKNIPYVLKMWDDYVRDKPEFSSGYSIQAYILVKNYFVLIDKINLLQEKLDKVST